MIGDILSALALGVSVFTWFRSSSVETRLRTQSDNREAFDAWIIRPMESSFQELELALNHLSAAIRANVKAPDRAIALRTIQSSEFDPWFFDFDAFCENHADEIVTQIRGDADVLVDGVLEAINEMSQDVGGKEMTEGARNIVRLKHNFISNSRGSLQAERLGIR